MKKVILLVTWVLYVGFANSAEHIQWTQGEIIKLESRLNQERKVLFPEPVRFGNKSKYNTLFRYNVIDTAFFITPITVFDEKMVFQGLNSQRFYIVKASVGDGVRANEDLIIHVMDNKSKEHELSNKKTAPLTTSKVNPIDVVQYVSQSLYSPSESLIEPTPGVRRVPVSLNHVPNLYQGGVFTANILGGWFGGGYYVTAVKLTNNMSSKNKFQPCKVRGDFYSAVAQFKYAFPKGHRADFTVVYLVSDTPFDVAIKKGNLQCV